MGDAGFGTSRVPVNWARSRNAQEFLRLAASSDVRRPPRRSGMRPALVVYGTPKFVHKDTGKGLTDLVQAGPASLEEILRSPRPALQPQRRLFRRGLRNRPSAGQDVDRLERAELEDQLVPKPEPKAYADWSRPSTRDLERRPEREDRARRYVRLPARPDVDEGDEFLKKMYKVGGIEKRFDANQLAPIRLRGRRHKHRVNELRSVAKRSGDGNVDLLVASPAGRPKVRLVVTSWSARRARPRRLPRRPEHADQEAQAAGTSSAHTSTPGATSRPASSPATGARGRGSWPRSSKPKPALRAVEKVIRKNR